MGVEREREREKDLRLIKEDKFAAKKRFSLSSSSKGEGRRKEEGALYQIH